MAATLCQLASAIQAVLWDGVSINHVAKLTLRLHPTSLRQPVGISICFSIPTNVVPVQSGLAAFTIDALAVPVQRMSAFDSHSQPIVLIVYWHMESMHSERSLSKLAKAFFDTLATGLSPYLLAILRGFS